MGAFMHRINIKEARRTLPELVERASKGEEIEITRRGLSVARLVPPTPPSPGRLPSMKEFRDSMKIKGGSIVALLIQQRRTARY